MMIKVYLMLKLVFWVKKVSALPFATFAHFCPFNTDHYLLLA